MKIFLVSFLAFFIGFAVFGQNSQKAVKNAHLTWKGEKLVGVHEGTIKLASGKLITNNDIVKGGKFVVDMTSINTTDLEEEGRQGLNAHLKSKDFFNVNTYPTSELEFSRILDKGNGNYQITANLTIKGITNTIRFNLYALKGKAHAHLVIDRTKYGIKYGSSNFFSGLGDYAIDDDFQVSIKFDY